jgi:LPXTG-site transpeptidase (sortase) family protein
MYQTLEDLEIQAEYEKMRQPKHAFSTLAGEVKIIMVIFISIFLGMYLITNAQLIIDNVQDRFTSTRVQPFNAEEVHSSANVLSDTKEKIKVADALIQKYSSLLSVEKEIAPTTDQFLRDQLPDYDFSFNRLPPTNRLVIAAINLDVPLIQTELKNYDEFSEGNFDRELENGVVKYPTTPNPGEGGNAFFFGHTSQEYWKYNKYGTVFRNIPQLIPGDVIQIVREGKLYEYKVITTEIVPPKQVNDTYLKYTNLEKEYLTLMGCYPIGRTDKRMMVIAERTT